MSSLSGFHLTSERFRIRFTADGKHQSGDQVLCTIIILQYLYKNIFVVLCQAISHKNYLVQFLPVHSLTKEIFNLNLPFTINIILKLSIDFCIVSNFFFFCSPNSCKFLSQVFARAANITVSDIKYNGVTKKKGKFQTRQIHSLKICIITWHNLIGSLFSTCSPRF